MNNIDMLMAIPVFGIIIALLVTVHCWDIDFSQFVNSEEKNEEDEAMKEYDKMQEKIKKENNPEHETIVMSNLGHIDINTIRNSDVRIDSVLEDLSKLIGVVMVNELYSIELTGGLYVGRDEKLKEVVNLITKKIIVSMGDNFRAKFYLFMNENLLIETIHSNVSRQVIAHVSKNKENIPLR